MPKAEEREAALAEILRLGPERLVYISISCEPSTHARDLIALVRGATACGEP